MPERTAGGTRGVSEVIGFALIAALIISTVSVVYVTGIGGLDSARDAERASNAERAFGVFADNMDDIHRRGAPARATEIKLAEAQLKFGEPTTMTVEVANVADSPTYSTDIEPVVYTTGAGTQLVYEGGAVIRVDDGSGVLKHPPSMVFRDGGSKTMIVPYMQTRSSGSSGIGGTTTVLVRSDLATREVLGAHTDPGTEYEVTLRIETTEARAPVWERHLNEEIPSALKTSDCDRSGGTVTCEDLAVDTLYVSATRADVTLTE